MLLCTEILKRKPTCIMSIGHTPRCVRGAFSMPNDESFYKSFLITIPQSTACSKSLLKNMWLLCPKMPGIYTFILCSDALRFVIMRMKLTENKQHNSSTQPQLPSPMSPFIILMPINRDMLTCKNHLPSSVFLRKLNCSIWSPDIFLPWRPIPHQALTLFPLPSLRMLTSVFPDSRVEEQKMFTYWLLMSLPSSNCFYKKHVYPMPGRKPNLPLFIKRALLSLPRITGWLLWALPSIGCTRMSWVSSKIGIFNTDRYLIPSSGSTQDEAHFNQFSFSVIWNMQPRRPRMTPPGCLRLSLTFSRHMTLSHEINCGNISIVVGCLHISFLFFKTYTIWMNTLC